MKPTLFALALALGCDGGSGSSQNSIVRATPTTHDQWPGVVALYRGSGYVCQGALIWPDIVLSASHCFEAPRPDTVIVGRDDRSTTAGTAYHIDNYCYLDHHDPRGCTGSTRVGDDLTLVHLAHPVPETEQRVVRLAIDSEVVPGTTVTAIGWQDPGPTLASAMTMLQTDCTVVGGGLRGITVCDGLNIMSSGDSGGPLYVQIGGERALAGIFSATLGVIRGAMAGPLVDFWEKVPFYLNMMQGVVGPLSPQRWKRDACEGTMPVSVPVWRKSMGYALRTTDLNHDGFDDLVAVTAEQMISWLAGPAGAFARTESPTPTGITDLAGASAVVGELDGVPGPDVAVVDPAAGYALHVFGSRPAAGGVNWVASSHPPLSLATLDSALSSAPVPMAADLWRARMLRIGDVNGDGFDDLVAVMDTKVRVLMNNGGTSWTVSDPGLAPNLFHHAANKRSTIVLADVAPDRPGAHELVVREKCGLAVYQRATAGTWSRIFAESCSDGNALSDHNGWRDAPLFTPLRAGHFNGDRCDDLLVRDRDRVRILDSNCLPGTRLAFSEQPTLADWFDSFPAGVGIPFFVGWEFWDPGLATGDFDGDGKLDFVGHGPFGVEGRLNAGDGTFRAVDPFRAMFPEPFELTNAATMLVGRYDGPAQPDRLLASHDICLDVWQLTSEPEPASCHVLSPPADAEESADYTLLPDGRMQIEVIFSEPVDLGSLGANVILSSDRNPSIAITIAPGATTSRILITTVTGVGGSCDFTPNCFVTLTLSGMGQGAARCVEGQVLDGDDDGIQGGDYATTFLILG